MAEWFSAIELVGLAGMPSTPQGINKKAKQEGWHKQKKMGKQGSCRSQPNR